VEVEDPGERPDCGLDLSADHSAAEDYSVLATTNLNGDYISDAAAAQVGGLGIAPGGNIGDGYAVFEATHGTAPKYADKDVINPGGDAVGRDAVRLSGLDGGGAADRELDGEDDCAEVRDVRLRARMQGATKAKTSEFATRG
jgi:isocitrate dehydrogenase